MIISRARRYVFVHIPKTGGTSLALALEARAMKDDILIGDTPKALRRRRRLRQIETRGRLWKHAGLADIDGLLAPAELAAMFTFTLVRNPWDRVVSYYHWLRHQRFDHPAVHLARRVDFDEFLRNPGTLHSLGATPAASYMRDAIGQERCDAYIRIERFGPDAASLIEHLGFGLDLPRVNVSERQADYRPYYKARTRDLVGQACAEDIARFGYCFDAGLVR